MGAGECGRKEELERREGRLSIHSFMPSFFPCGRGSEERGARGAEMIFLLLSFFVSLSPLRRWREKKREKNEEEETRENRCRPFSNSSSSTLLYFTSYYLPGGRGWNRDWDWGWQQSPQYYTCHFSFLEQLDYSASSLISQPIPSVCLEEEDEDENSFSSLFFSSPFL